MTSSLYIVTHIESGRCYVGWTSKCVEQRWAEHRGYARSVCKTYFHKALRKHGPDAFEWSVVKHFDSPDEALQSEIEWIARLRHFGVPLFNLTDGGDGIRGHRHSEETRQKMRRPKSAEHKEKLRAANKGKPSPMRGRRHSDETKAKLSAAKRGKPSPLRGRRMPEETKALLRRPKSAEHRAKISASLKGRAGKAQSPETRAKCSAALKGKPKSAEHRAKLSEANRGKPNPMKGRHHSDETKDKIRQAALRRSERCCNLQLSTDELAGSPRDSDFRRAS